MIDLPISPTRRVDVPQKAAHAPWTPPNLHRGVAQHLFAQSGALRPAPNPAPDMVKAFSPTKAFVHLRVYIANLELTSKFVAGTLALEAVGHG